MAINEIDENKPGAPTDLTEVAESSPVAPTNLTEVSENSPAAPTDLTEVAESGPAAPTDLTEVAESTPLAPVNLTEVAESAPAAPTNLAEVSLNPLFRSISPVIDLDFKSGSYSQLSSPKTFSQIVNYSRASSATFINRRLRPDGRYEYFLDTDYVGNVENLITWAEVYSDADWTKTRSSIDGNKIIEDSSNNTHFINQTYTTAASTTYTLFFDLKAGERVQARVRNQSLTNVYVLVNLENGAIIEQSNCVGYSEYLGDGVFRFGITFDSGAGGAQLMALELAEGGTNSYQGDGSSGLYVYKSQLTESSKPLPYVATTSTAVTEAFAESPRFAYNPVSGEAEGVLVERGSTNLVVRSQEADDPAWTKVRSSVTADVMRAPDGTYSADKLIEDATAANTHIISIGASFTSGTTYTASIYTKAGERNECYLLLESAAFGVNVRYDFTDLEAGTIVETTAGTNSSASIEYLFDGWYRISITADAIATSAAGFRFGLSNGTSTYDGDGSSGMFIWQAQVEASPYPTSSIHTIGSTVSRSADDLDLKSPSAHPNIETGQELTLFAEMRTLSNNTHPTDNRTVISTGSTGARFNLIRIDSTIDYYNYYRAGASDRGALNSDTSLSHKITATSSKSNLVSVYQDGVLTDSDTKAPSVSGIVQDAYIGRFSSSAGYFDGYIKRISVYDVELTAQEVAKL